MKHFLNFKPTVVYRKGSSFMLKTSLLILYAVPLALFFFWSFNYFVTVDLNQFYQDAEKQLTKKTEEFNERMVKLRPAKDDLEEAEKIYFDYRKVSSLCQSSWSGLLNSLEKLAPAQIRFKRIGIKPDKLVRISLEGEAAQLSYLTGFLRSLFAEKIFINPNLKKHNKSVIDGNEAINFSLEVDYVGERGELP